jgi:Baseplate J-like protein
MIVEAPNIDSRSREEVASQVRRLLTRYVPGWPGRSASGAANALIGVFAQLCGVVIDRLNKAPRKNLLAFLDMIGASPLAAQPARVPLTFHLAAQHTGHVTVPALTQVAATLEKGEEEPVLFETEREMVVTSAVLSMVGVKDGAADVYDDYSSLLEKPAAGGVQMLRGGTLLEHDLYLDLGLPTPPPALDRIVLSFELEAPGPPAGPNWLLWEIRDAGGNWTPLTPASDGTLQLSGSGEVAFDSPPPMVLSIVDGRPGYWLRCRTLQPLSAQARAISIREIAVRLESERKNLPVEAALANSVVLDPSKDFYPLGQHPAFGDTFYLACAEAFSKPGAAVTIHVALVNPTSGGEQVPIPPVAARSVRLRWEVWDGRRWAAAGVAESGRASRDDAAGFDDETKAVSESGAVTLRIPASAAPLKLAGQNSFWVRARLVGGDYGRPPSYEKDAAGVYAVTPPSFAPPAISTLAVDYTWRTQSPPARTIVYSDFTYLDVDPRTAPFHPFQPAPETCAYCYFGFLAAGQFSDRSMSLYFGVANPPDRKTVLHMATSPQATLAWEYWNGSAWIKRTVIDDTDAFRRSGIVRFLAPRDFSPRAEFGRAAYWLRVRTLAGAGYEPRLRLVRLNTTMASQSVTISSEVLGSSNGKPGQTFRTTRRPILAGQQLEVLEPAMPSADAQRMIRDEERDDAIRRADPADPRGGGVWVRWHEVPNFNASGERDRHYVLNRDTGEVVFGDGLSGRIPFAAPRNIVMATYRIGGGASGNRRAQTIEQLKTAIPYVDRVTNPEPSGGGADPETLDRLLDRAPRQLRHGLRAVTAQDFEDLAMLASPEVGRARCIPLADLAQDPDGNLTRPGVFTLIIAPVVEASAELIARPVPSMELIRRVRDFLDERRSVEPDLVIVGPEYVAVKVETEFAVTDPDTASDVELAVTRTLSRFLHPAIGRKDGGGWNFGEEPARSDLFALIEDVPGVDHVRELNITRLEDRPGAYRTGYFLTCGAEPRVTATLEK